MEWPLERGLTDTHFLYTTISGEKLPPFLIVRHPRWPPQPQRTRTLLSILDDTKHSNNCASTARARDDCIYP